MLLVLAGGTTDLLAQPGAPGGGGPGDPVCWPPSTCETPINNELIILLIGGLGLALYYIKKNNNQTKSVV